MLDGRFFKFIVFLMFFAPSVSLYGPPGKLVTGLATSLARCAPSQVCRATKRLQAPFIRKDPEIRLERAAEKLQVNFCQDFFDALAFSDEPVVVPYIENIKEALIDVINSAKQYIFASIYSISEPAIVHAMAEAVKRGVEVLMVVDKHSMSHSRGALAYLIQNGIRVYNPRSRTMHRKCCVVDCFKVWSGSFNWTANACRNYEDALLTIGNKELVLEHSIAFATLLSRSDRLEVAFLDAASKGSGQGIERDCQNPWDSLSHSLEE